MKRKLTVTIEIEYDGEGAPFPAGTLAQMDTYCTEGLTAMAEGVRSFYQIGAATITRASVVGAKLESSSTTTETAPCDTIPGCCEMIRRDRRQVVANTKRLKELVWQDREIRTGPARRAEILVLLESGLETEAMVEVLDTLLHRYVTEMSRRLIRPAGEKLPDLPAAGGAEVHVDGKLFSAAEVAYVQSLGVLTAEEEAGLFAEYLAPWRPCKEEWIIVLKRTLLEVARELVEPLTKKGRAGK